MKNKKFNNYQYDNLILLKGIDLPAGKFHAGFQDFIFNNNLYERKIKTAIWYPTKNPPIPVLYQDIFSGNAAIDATIEPGKFPVIFFSHGSEGHRFNQHYLAEFMASHGYIVVSVEHPGNSAFDNELSFSIENLWFRPQDISFVLDKLLSSVFEPYINKKKIGFSGHSYGGYTGLVLAGAIPDYEKIQYRFKSSSFLQSFQLHKNKHLQETRIKSFFLMAPAVAEAFSADESRKNIHSPIALLTSKLDELLQKDNDFFMTHLIHNVKNIHFKEAGHYIYLMNCPDRIKKTGEISCLDIGSKREIVHPFLKWHMLTFFKENFE